LAFGALYTLPCLLTLELAGSVSSTMIISNLD
jgi:hypothetical protein